MHHGILLRVLPVAIGKFDVFPGPEDRMGRGYRMLVPAFGRAFGTDDGNKHSQRAGAERKLEKDGTKALEQRCAPRLESYNTLYIE